MRRRFGRKKRRSLWLPTIGDRTTIGQEPDKCRLSYFKIDWTSWDAASNCPGNAVRAVTLDSPRSVDFAGTVNTVGLVTSLADLEGSAYMFDGIVGTVTHCSQPLPADVQANTAPGFIVGVGFRVSEWDPYSNTPEDSLHNQVLNADNYARSRWIWRRVWTFSFDLGNHAVTEFDWSGTSNEAFNQFPSGNPTDQSGYSGALESTSIVAKSKRRISNDERLVVCVSVAPLPLQNNGTDPETPWNDMADGFGASIFDIRILGHLVKNRPGARG